VLGACHVYSPLFAGAFLLVSNLRHLGTPG
jgi:hypothetical protein